MPSSADKENSERIAQFSEASAQAKQVKAIKVMIQANKKIRKKIEKNGDIQAFCLSCLGVVGYYGNAKG